VERADSGPAAEFYRHPAFEPVRVGLMKRERAASANLGHRYFTGDRPCALLIDEIEALWALIAAADDWSGWRAKLDEIAVAAEAYGVTTPGVREASGLP
jgi:hypothetical protein